MAFLRTNFKTLNNANKARFSTDYKFSKKTNFKVGREVYIILLGLEEGFYETPCHRVLTHKVNDKTVGFKNASFPVYIKCKGVDSDGNKSESLCCTLAQLEKERIPDKNDSGKRIISFTSNRVHLPVLILGNSLADKNKEAYPISKVSILNDLRSESGLNFAYIEMASSSFKNDILTAYGKRLKEEGLIEYDLKEDSEDFQRDVCTRLTNTIIKVSGISKTGFSAAMKEYSFFPFSNPAIASASPAGEREAILGYKDNQEIQNKICEFLDLFKTEVDNMFNDWTDKDLQEYYNSAIGVDIKSSTAQTVAAVEEADEEIEILEDIGEEEAEPQPQPQPQVESKPKKVVKKEPVKETPKEDEELEEILSEDNLTNEPIQEESLDEFEHDMEDDFFNDEE